MLFLTGRCLGGRGNRLDDGRQKLQDQQECHHSFVHLQHRRPYLWSWVKIKDKWAGRGCEVAGTVTIMAPVWTKFSLCSAIATKINIRLEKC
jgi:hypothetical protein